MIDVVTIEDNLFTIIDQISSIPVIVARPNGPSPTGDYLTFKVQDISQIATEMIGETDASGNTPVKATYELAVIFSSYRQGTKQDINNLQFHLYNNPIVIDDLISDGLHIKGTPIPIKDLPAVMEGRWEERSQFTANFLLVNEEIIDTSYIGTVTIEGDYLDTDGSLRFESDITITDT